MISNERAVKAQRAVKHRQASGDALRAFCGLPVAGEELPERLAPVAVCAADVSIVWTRWHRPMPAFKTEGAPA